MGKAPAVLPQGRLPGGVPGRVQPRQQSGAVLREISWTTTALEAPRVANHTGISSLSTSVRTSSSFSTSLSSAQVPSSVSRYSRDSGKTVSMEEPMILGWVRLKISAEAAAPSAPLPAPGRPARYMK